MALHSNLFRTLRNLRRLDDRRAGVPGEHWASFGAGMTAIKASRRLRSPVLRGAVWLAGGLLVARALSGRDGPLARLRRTRSVG